MTPESELASRYSPGEDARPLVRALSGGVIGAAAALLVDGVIAAALGRDSLLPGLLGMSMTDSASAVAAGRALLVAVACLASLVYAYGQVRRFVPGPGWLKGAGCGFCVWAIAAPALLPDAAGSLVRSGAPAGLATAEAALVAAGALAAALACGTIIGAFSPPRPG